MVFSELLLALPYKLAYNIAKSLRKSKNIHFYAADELDYIVFRNVNRKLSDVKIVAGNRKLAKLLRSKYGVDALLYPTFPDIIIMARHSLHKYPEKSILKIGMRHGPYHFKNFIGAEKYNRFDLFLLTSEIEVEQAKRIGITNSVAGGFPKSDDLFDENIISNSSRLKNEIFGNDKPTVLFSSTWDKSGISGVNIWYEQIESLANEFNVLVTLHPWTSKEIVTKVRATQGVYFIEGSDINPYLLMADCLVGDTSSIIAEYMLLDRPIITFEIPAKGRLSTEIVEMLEKVSFRISSADELHITIKLALESLSLHSSERHKAVEVMFAKGLGNHAEKASELIVEFAMKNGISITKGNKL